VFSGVPKVAASLIPSVAVTLVWGLPLIQRSVDPLNSYLDFAPVALSQANMWSRFGGQASAGGYTRSCVSGLTIYFTLWYGPLIETA
jgi:hypothetical protein